MKSVYLAGPITGYSYGEVTDWREHFKSLVSGGIECLSPMRGKEYLKALSEGSDGKVADSYPGEVLSCDRGIMTRDYFDCKRASVVVANLLGATRVSVGTVMEIAWAYDGRTPVIAVMEPGNNCHDHSMIREAIGFRVVTLDEAAHIVNTILNTGVVDAR